MKKIILLALLSIVLAPAFADAGETTVTFSLTNFLGLIFGLISLLISGPIAWIILGVMRDMKELSRNHDELKEKVLTGFVRRPDHDSASARLETRIENMSAELSGKLDRIFDLVGDLERNKADKPFGRQAG